MRKSLPTALTLLALLATSAAAQSDKIAPELLTAMTAQPISPGAPPVQQRIMVTLKKPVAMDTMSYRTSAGMALIQSEVDKMQESVLSSRLEGSYRTLYRYKSLFGFSAIADPAAIEQIASLPEVERVEVLPLYFKQSNESHPLTALDTVHAMGFTGAGVTIAVIDDGIDHDHAAFGGHAAFPNAKIVGGSDFADNDGDPTIDCTEQSHGTAVAGVAAGNGGGITGTAPDASIVMLKVQSAMLCGQPALDGDLVAAIDWAVTHRDDFDIRVLSMSLGFGEFATPGDCAASSFALRDAVRAAADAGLVVLAASGNAGLCNAMARPACLDDAISVGATYDDTLTQRGFCVSPNSCIGVTGTSCDQRGQRACFDTAPGADAVTCYSNSADFLDILAPSDCATTAAAGGGTNACFNGTSSATPFAAGVVAALIEADPTIDNERARALLADHGVDVLDVKSNRTTPRLEAGASLAALNVGCTPGLDEDFENGLGDWVADGLWHLVAGSSCLPAPPSPTSAAYYGRDGDCDYDTGNNAGTLTSPEITGLDAGSELTFSHLRQVESFGGGSFDRTRVEVVTAGGATEIFALDSGDPSAGAWVSSPTLSLGAFAGETIRLRFSFDTMDDVANDFTGWAIDDVRVTGSGMCASP